MQLAQKIINKWIKSVALLTAYTHNYSRLLWIKSARNTNILFLSISLHLSSSLLHLLALSPADSWNLWTKIKEKKRTHFISSSQ